MFEGKKILITGGTGSLGTALTRKLLKLNVKTIRILSRNESKQVEMKSNFDDDRLRFLIGDIKDLPRLNRAFSEVDIVFHAAALKHVSLIEYNPFEAIKTNVLGSQNVIDAAIEQGVKTVVSVGTDKAVAPLNAYGATKLLMEKSFVSANNYVIPDKTKFISLRYGNVFGSSGSVIPIFIRQIQNMKQITITDPKMTRFSITMDEALEFILEATKEGKGGEVFVPELKAYTINDLKNALFEILGNTGEKIIGLRPGEKMHEDMIINGEMKYTWKLGKNYVIFHPRISEEEIRKKHPNIKKVERSSGITSESVEKISNEQLRTTISNYLEKPSLS
jgi:UDP-N-acetylglucosamine 4,6-dehydratase/5-epimerase